MANDLASIGRVTRGASYRLPVAWDEPDPFNAGQRRQKNITNYTVTFGARLRPGQTPFLTKSSASSGITKTNAANGECEVVGLPADYAGAVASTTDVYCYVKITNDSDPNDTSVTGFRLRVAVVDA